MGTAIERPGKLNERYAGVLALALLLRPVNDNEIGAKEREGIKSVMRKEPEQDEREKRRIEDSSKIAQTYAIVSLGQVTVQGYGTVTLYSKDYVMFTYTRSNGVPTNMNSIVDPVTGAIGVAVPYSTDEFQKVA